MTKTYFVSYWNMEYNKILNTEVKLELELDNIKQGRIAILICSKLDVNSRLINFWEI